MCPFGHQYISRVFELEEQQLLASKPEAVLVQFLTSSRAGAAATPTTLISHARGSPRFLTKRRAEARIAVDTLSPTRLCRKGSREFFQTSSVKRIRAKSDFVCASLHTEKDNSTDFQQALRT